MIAPVYQHRPLQQFCEFLITLQEQHECTIPPSKLHAVREEFMKSYPAWPDYRSTDNSDIEVGNILLPYDEFGISND
jgi:hypothetical protein